jgi:hypothetical protein
MGEKDHLERCARLGQHIECKRHARVVEAHEDVVTDEGQRIGARRELAERSEAAA